MLASWARWKHDIALPSALISFEHSFDGSNCALVTPRTSRGLPGGWMADILGRESTRLRRAVGLELRLGKERRITRKQHEHVLEAAQRCPDENSQAMRQRRETVEHPFGMLKMRNG